MIRWKCSLWENTSCFSCSVSSLRDQQAVNCNHLLDDVSASKYTLTCMFSCLWSMILVVSKDASIIILTYLD